MGAVAEGDNGVALGDLVDLDRYPLDQPTASHYLDVVEAARRSLRADGCAIVRNLVKPEAVANLNSEITDQKPTTHFSTQTINPYFHTEHNPDFPDHHPVNTFIERSSGFIPGDSWTTGGPMDSLFHAPELTRFLVDCLEIPELHCYADPLAGLTANILDPGQQFTWRRADLPWPSLIAPGHSGTRVIRRVERTQQLFGRVLEAHLEAERQRVRSDALID
jgi:hypothetical protein